MNELSQLISPESIVQWLSGTALQSSLVICLLFLLTHLFRYRLTAQWRYALWGLVVLTLLMPILPASPTSFQNIRYAFENSIDETTSPPGKNASIHSANLPAAESAASPESRSSIDSIQLPIENSAPKGVRSNEHILTMPMHTIDTLHEPAAAPALSSQTNWWLLLTLIWFFGVIFLLLRVMMESHLFYRRAINSQVTINASLARQYQACCQAMNIKKPPQLIVTNTVKSPSLAGLFHRTVMLPDGMHEQMSESEIQFIFQHELMHHKRGDLWACLLMAVMKAVFWFNPLLWLATRHVHDLCEQACDADVITYSGVEQGNAYGHVLIKVTELLQSYHKSASIKQHEGQLAMGAQGHLRERIVMLNAHRNGFYQKCFGVCLMLCVAMVGLTRHTTPILGEDVIENQKNSEQAKQKQEKGKQENPKQGLDQNHPFTPLNEAGQRHDDKVFKEARDLSAAGQHINAVDHYIYFSKPHPERKEKAAQLLAEFFKASPQDAIAWLPTSPIELRWRMYSCVGEIWAKSDPAASSKWAGQLEKRWKKWALTGVGRGWASHNMPDALSWLSTLDRDTKRLVGMMEFFEACLKSDPEKACDWLALHLESGHRYPQNYLYLVAKQDPKKAASLLIHTRHDLSSSKAVIAKTWMRTEALAAMDWALEQKMDFSKHRFHEDWAKKDPESALTWLARHKGHIKTHMSRSSLPQTSLAYGVIKIWEKKDRTQAILEAIKLGFTDEAIFSVHKWARSGNKQNAIEWFDQIEDMRAKNVVSIGMIQGLAWSQPAFTSEHLPAIEDEKMRRSTLAKLMWRWDRKNPDAVIKWANQLKDDALRRKAYQDLGTVWYRGDQKAAKDYWQAMSKGEFKDAMLVGMVIDAYKADAKACFVWINELKDQADRLIAISQITREYIQSNRNIPADHWATMLSKEEKAAINEILTKKGKKVIHWG